MKKILTILFIASLTIHFSNAQIDPLNSIYADFGSYTVVSDSDATISPEVLIFRPDQPGSYPVFIFQLGANGVGSTAINKHTYDLYMEHLASYGIVSIVIDDSNAGMPSGTSFNTVLDWFNTNVTDNTHWLYDYCDPEKVILGGHSNGGVNACAIIDGSTSTDIAGLILLASYPSNVPFFGHDVSGWPGKLLSIAGSEDDASTPDACKTGYDAFSSTTCKTWVLVEGMGHGGFGDYDNPDQPVGTIGRDSATATVRHYLTSFILSEFESSIVANAQLTTELFRPGTIAEFESSCTGTEPECGNPYGVGNTTITFNDPNRNDRPIETKIYYPAETNGTDVEMGCPDMLDEEFPLIVIGHGFVISTDAYQNFWADLVPKGYIIALPTTEGSVPPDHGAFGEDLKFLAEHIKDESINNSSSIFYEKVTNECAIMGHSMGGGSTILAAANNTNISAIVTLALNETTPSAIDTAQYITVPSLVLSGGNDCVSLADSNQVPTHCNIGSNEKYYASIIGGSHCQFANSSTTCDFGESTCTPAPEITREEQHDIALNLVGNFLDWKLKSDIQAGVLFNDTLDNSNRLTTDYDCDPTSKYEMIMENISIFPNPADNNIFINTPFDVFDYSIYSITGKQIINEKAVSYSKNININNIESGIYLLEIRTESGKYTKKIIIK